MYSWRVNTVCSQAIYPAHPDAIISQENNHVIQCWIGHGNVSLHFVCCQRDRNSFCRTLHWLVITYNRLTTNHTPLDMLACCLQGSKSRHLAVHTGRRVGFFLAVWPHCNAKEQTQREAKLKLNFYLDKVPCFGHSSVTVSTRGAAPHFTQTASQ